MEGHPHLNTLFILFNEEIQPFRKVHRMIDLFESIIKTYTVVIISEYVKRNKLSDTAKELLAHGLRTPSLGTWQLFSRVLFEELNNEKHQWMLTDFKADFEYLDKALEKEETNAISLRNSYAHGATPSDEKCTLDINKFESFLNKLLNNKWFDNTKIEVIDGMVSMISGNNTLCLHPILLYRREKSPASFAFFNDLKNEKVGLLNYPLAKHYREKKFYSEFHEYLPLQNWKTKGNNEFYQRIEELTDTFKGRNVEREKLLHFVIQKNKGYFSVQGNPGVGKSALLAQFLKDLRTNEETKKIKVVPYFIRRGTFQARVNHFLNYLINGTDKIFPQGRDIHAKEQTSWSLQSQLFQKWNQWAENNNGNKILFLIDGLDEGIDDNMVEFMPRENFENILFIYGSRAGGHYSISEFWGTLPTEHHTKLELKGLNKEDIRSMIYEVANKYEVERESSWINAVQERSQGNPLYMKLLCDAIENGHIALNDINSLPKEIDDYYKAILQRYAKDNDGDALFLGLYTFAAAKNYLTIPQLGLINKLSDATLERVGSTLKEVLNENPLTKDVLDYQLFHESFREYLVKQNGVKVMEAADRLINFCADWQTLEGTYEQRYALEYYAIHLIESKKEVHHKELLALLKNEPYQVAQKRVLKQFDATKQLFQLSLIKAGELNKHDIQLEAALGLLDLKYEVANDAPQIVLLIANGEIDLGLKRIESFAGPEKEGIKRKFILYMLCLMKLTLLDSKDKSYRKTSIEKLLNHLDEHLPVDHSLINWNDFFPSYLVFLMATEWATLGLDYLIVYKRTSEWEKEWIKEKGPYSDIQFEVLQNCSQNLIQMEETLKLICLELAKQREKFKALEHLEKINQKIIKEETLFLIYETLLEINEIIDFQELYDLNLEVSKKDKLLRLLSLKLLKSGSLIESLVVTSKIKSLRLRCLALIDISDELLLKDRNEEATIILNNAYDNSIVIKDLHVKGIVLIKISNNLAKLGKIKESKNYISQALEGISRIKNGPIRNKANLELYFTLDKKNNRKLAEMLSKQIFLDAIEIKDKNDFDDVMSLSSIEFAKNGKFKISMTYYNLIIEEQKRINSMIVVSNELAKVGKVEESLECAKRINDNYYRDIALKNLCIELSKRGRIIDAENYASEMNSWENLSKFLIASSIEMLKEINEDSSEKMMMRIVNISKYFNKCSSEKNIYYEQIINALVNRKRLKESYIFLQEILILTPGISNLKEKAEVLMNVSIEYLKNGKFEEAELCGENISFQEYKDKTILIIICEMLKVDNLAEAQNCAKKINEEEMLNKAIKYISIKMAELDRTDEAIYNSRVIRKNDIKIDVFSRISTELTKLGRIYEASSLIKEALDTAHKIEDEFYKSIALKYISQELVKQRKIEEALDCVGNIVDIRIKVQVLCYISNQIALQGLEKEANRILSEAFKIAKLINEFEQGKYIREISIQMSNQGDLLSAKKYAISIFDKFESFLAMHQLSLVYAKKSKIYEAAQLLHDTEVKAYQINDDYKYLALIEIFDGFVKIGELKEGERVIEEIFVLIRSENLHDVLPKIAIALAEHKYWSLSERAILEILEIGQRHNSWEHFAEEFMLKEGWENALLHVNKLQKEEARFFYLKGLVNNLTIIETNSECVEQVLPYLTNDTESIEKLMQNYALFELFFGDSDQNKIQRLNQSLNIKWAMDIKKEFPSVALSSRVYSNIKEWLHDIYDEDIKDQIELWARQVSNGKISEDQFNAKVESLLSN